jgi:hypothetical protein
MWFVAYLFVDWSNNVAAIKSNYSKQKENFFRVKKAVKEYAGTLMISKMMRWKLNKSIRDELKSQ